MSEVDKIQSLIGKRAREMDDFVAVIKDGTPSNAKNKLEMARSHRRGSTFAGLLLCS